jgi:hypothetical protein
MTFIVRSPNSCNLHVARREIRKMDIILTKFGPIIKSESQAFQMMQNLVL